MLAMVMTGRLLAKNALINIVGQAAPFVVAVVAIPVALRGFGPERFAILTFAWLVMGYSSAFDLGVARALTKFAAAALHSGDRDQLAKLTRTGLAINAILGTVGAAVVAVFGIFSVQVLNVPPNLVEETRWAFVAVACIVPVTLFGSAMRALLEAALRFGSVNLVSIPTSALAYGIPALAALAPLPLPQVMALLVLSRLLSSAAYGALVRATWGDLWRHSAADWQTVRQLLRFGGWVTGTGVAAFVFVYVERLLIAALQGVAAVTFYVVPYELVVRLWVIPSSLSATLFPAFSAMLGRPLDDAIGRLYGRALKYLLLFIAPIVWCLIFFSRDLLTLWLGASFADRGSAVLAILAIGVFANSLAYVPHALLEASGRPDVLVKIHFALAVPALVATIFFITAFGLVGAAVVWTLRLILVSVLLFAIAPRMVPPVIGAYRNEGVNRSAIGLLLMYVTSASAFFLSAISPWRPAIVLLAAALTGAIMFRFLTNETDRRLMIAATIRAVGRPASELPTNPDHLPPS